MSHFELVNDVYSANHVLRILVDHFNQTVAEEIVRKGSRMVANRILRDHRDELLAKVNLDEIARLVTAQLTEKLK